MAKILVVNAAGQKQWVPEHWLNHPVLGLGFKLPPSERAKARTKKQPSASRRKPVRRTVEPTQPVPGDSNARSDNAQDDR